MSRQVELADNNPFMAPKSEWYYRHKVQLYGKIISSAYRFKLDRETTDRWTEFSMLMRAADTYIDIDDTDQSRERIGELISYCLTDRVSELYPHLSLANLGWSTSLSLIETTLDMFDFNARVREAKSPAEYYGASTMEGRRIAQLYTLLASDSVQAQPRFLTFARHLEIAGGWSNFGDNVIDFKKDSASQYIAMEYSLTRHLELAAIQTKAAYYLGKRAVSSVRAPG